MRTLWRVVAVGGMCAAGGTAAGQNATSGPPQAANEHESPRRVMAQQALSQDSEQQEAQRIADLTKRAEAGEAEAQFSLGSLYGFRARFDLVERENEPARAEGNAAKAIRP